MVYCVFPNRVQIGCTMRRRLAVTTRWVMTTQRRGVEGSCSANLEQIRFPLLLLVHLAILAACRKQHSLVSHVDPVG